MPEQPLDLDAISARIAAASPGPWRKLLGTTHVHGADGDFVASFADHRDCDFVAQLHADITALLAEHARLTSELEAANRDRVQLADSAIRLGAELLDIYPGVPSLPALLAVLDERARQDAKWGAGSADKNPDGTGPHTRPLYAHTATGIADDDEAHYIRDVLQGRVDWRAAKDGTADRPLTHADILLEEVAEVLAEDDPAKLRAELVQVAAYAVKWIESIDRRENTAALAEGVPDA